MRTFNVVAAMLPDRGIGKNGTISWPPIRKDFEHYTTLTAKSKDPSKKCINVKGRVTLEETSEFELSRPNVVNIVISRTLKSCPHHVFAVVQSWDEAMAVINRPPLSDVTDTVWVMGGRAVYETALKSPLCDRVYLTRIHAHHHSDTFFPQFEQDFDLIKDPQIDGTLQTENGVSFQNEVYVRKR